MWELNQPQLSVGLACRKQNHNQDGRQAGEAERRSTSQGQAGSDVRCIMRHASGPTAYGARRSPAVQLDRNPDQPTSTMMIDHKDKETAHDSWTRLSDGSLIPSRYAGRAPIQLSSYSPQPPAGRLPQEPPLPPHRFGAPDSLSTSNIPALPHTHISKYSTDVSCDSTCKLSPPLPPSSRAAPALCAGN